MKRILDWLDEPGNFEVGAWVFAMFAASLLFGVGIAAMVLIR